MSLHGTDTPRVTGTALRRAFSKPTVDDYEFERLMGGFRAEGYAGLQLKMGQFLPWVEDADGWLARWGEDPGRASALIFFGTLEPDDLVRLARTIEFASRVGSERVIFCHNHPREGVDDEQLRAFARQLSGYGEAARAGGVAFSLHHHFEQPVMHPADFDTFFGEVEPGTVGLTVDTAHLAKSGIADIPGFIRTHAGLIDNVHLKDFSDGQWRLFGEGDLDLVGILAALQQIGYDQWLCVDEESDATLDDGLARSREWLDAHS